MELIAHRGNNNHQYAENTLEAIMDSINKNYVAGIEIDIRMTKDNKIVVIHDCLINNVSDGMGLVKDFTLSQLQVYNFGTVTHPSKITTLESVLANISNGKKILIEIKEETDHFENLIVSLMTVLDKYPNRNI
ncbi:MAG: glycerophosphodiester phosphodiesterase family protein, partial [Bacilli bacterium]